MNKTRNINPRFRVTALCAAVLCLLGGQSAWSQSPTQRGVVAKTNVTQVNETSTTNGQVVSVAQGATVTVNDASQEGKVARVTVSPTTVAATSATITGATTVNVNNTITLTATVIPSYANTVVWTVTPGTGSAEFVSGETTAETVTAVVNHETGQTTATLKGLEAGTVTVNVKATGDAAATLNETAKTVTVLNVPATLTTAPTATSAASQASYVLYGSSTALVSTGAASGGTMMYAVTTENTQPAKSAFSSTVPTASGRAAGKYYVWYYVQGDDSHIDTDISSTSILVPVVKREEFNSPFSTYVESTKSITGSNFKIEAWKNGSVLWVSSDGNNRMSISSLNSQKIWKIRLDFSNGGAYISVTPTFTPNSPNCSYYYNNVAGDRYSIITRNSTDFIGTSCTMTLDHNNGFGGFNKVTIYYY